jgi:hypothetical protein
LILTTETGFTPFCFQIDALQSLALSRQMVEGMSVAQQAFKQGKQDVDKLEDAMADIEDAVRVLLCLDVHLTLQYICVVLVFALSRIHTLAPQMADQKEVTDILTRPLASANVVDEVSACTCTYVCMFVFILCLCVTG